MSAEGFVPAARALALAGALTLAAGCTQRIDRYQRDGVVG